MSAQQNKENFSGHILRTIRQATTRVGFLSALLFIFSGRLDWLWAWIYLVIDTIMAVSIVFILPKDSLEERSKYKTAMRKWEKIIFTLNFFSISSIFLTAGLDYRFHWSPNFGLWVRVAAFALLTFASTLSTWAIVSNPFFSPGVGIQSDRGHYSVTSGPYRYIRHPGYAGSILFNLATTMMLGSLWALIPAAISIALFVIRIILEDSTLQKELYGYKEYAKKVRYRLIPGIW